MDSKPVFYNTIRAKVAIISLILSTCCVYFMTWQLKSQQHCQTYLQLLEEGKHMKQPVIYVKGIYLPENSDKRWVEKSYFRRGCMVKTIQANPLRVYVLDNILMLRFAEKRYYPKNLDDPATYITDGAKNEIGAEIKRASQVKPIKTYMERYKYIDKKAYDNFMISAGEDPFRVYAQIYDAIRDVLGTNAKEIEENSDPETKYTQITRWDFVLDANMTVHFMGVNNIPLLNCYELPELWGKYFCDHVVYNTFRAMGLEKPSHWKNNRAFHARDTDLQISNEVCYSMQCSSCDTPTCAICSHCLSSRQTRILKEILREHLHRGETRLIYPDGKNNENNDEASDQDTQWTDNGVVTQWLKAKCKQDHNWCSPYAADRWHEYLR